MSENGFHVDDTDEMSCYKKDALAVVHLKLIYDKEDLTGKNAVHFKPEMAHQVFGDSELIFGYRSLTININYHHNSANCYVDVKSSGKIQNGNMKPDNIMECLNDWLPENYCTKLEEFLEKFQKDRHDVMYGEVLEEFKDKNELKYFQDESVYATYKIVQGDLKDQEFKKFHSRFETFIVWFIDAANLIDLEDERWMIFYVYEEFQHPKTKKTFRSPIGFCTLYKFYAYPSSVRARISQFFVLPSHQRRGIGTKLYQTVVKTIRNMPEVVDITVEEPTATFQKIRDIDDALLIHNEFKNSKLNYTTTSTKKAYEVMKARKIGKKQAQRINDILSGCYAWHKGSTEFRSFLDGIKNRFKEEAERGSQPGKRFCGVPGSVVVQDKSAQIETDFKKYVDDIEPSFKYLRQHIKSCTD